MTNISSQSPEQTQITSSNQQSYISETIIKKFKDYFLTAQPQQSKNEEQEQPSSAPSQSTKDKPSNSMAKNHPTLPIKPAKLQSHGFDDDLLTNIASMTLTTLIQHVESAYKTPNIQHITQLNVSYLPKESLIITVKQASESKVPTVHIQLTAELMALIQPMLPQLKERLKEKSIKIDEIKLTLIEDPPNESSLNK